jgi:hypothetical protein
VDDKLWSYCDACGVAWEHPEEARLESGLNKLIELPKQQAGGRIGLPSAQEVAEKEFEKYVVRIAQDFEFKHILVKLDANERLE